MPRESAGAGDPAAYEEREVVPKKLVTSSGSHCSGGMVDRDMWHWMDIWLRDQPDTNGLFEDRVENYYETEVIAAGRYATVTTGDDWPFPETEWRDYHLQPDGTLATEMPDVDDSLSMYLSGVPRENWFFYAPQATETTRSARGLPDSLAFETDPLAEDVVIAGPILFDMYASLAGTNTEVFVSINDVTPDGQIAYLQRGLQRASFRAVNENRSFYTEDGRMYQPWRPYTNPQPVEPGAIERYRIEVFPVGHVFRAGHRIRIGIHTPPLVDALSGYTPEREPMVVSVCHDAENPSLIRLPVVEADEPIDPPVQDCGVPGGSPCSEPLTNDEALEAALDHAAAFDVAEAIDDDSLAVLDEDLTAIGSTVDGRTLLGS